MDHEFAGVIKTIAETFAGAPTAIALALVAFGLFYFYRRDHLLKHQNAKEDRETLLTVVQEVTRAVDKNTQSAENFQRNIEIIASAFERRLPRR